MPKEYIERTAAQEEIKKICNEYNYAYGDSYGGFAEKIANVTNNVPTADVQEVRHGKWIEKPYLLGTSNFCSLCGENYGMPHGKYNYCPNCGAKMDKE